MYGTMYKRRSYNGRSSRGFRPSMHSRTKAPVRRRKQAFSGCGLPSLRGNVFSNSKLQVVEFRRWTNETQYSLLQSSTSVGNELSFGGAFKLGDIINVAEMKSMFDQYKITGVSFYYYPDINTNDWGVTGTAHNVRPTIYASFDPDDSVTTTLAVIKERSDTRRYDAFMKQRWFVKPKPILAINFTEDASVQVNGGAYNGWLDMNNTNTSHYGLKLLMHIPQSTSDQPFKFRVVARYYFKCRGVR